MLYPEWLIDFFRSNKINFQAIVDFSYKEPKNSIFQDFLTPIKQKQRYIALPYVAVDNLVKIYVVGAFKERELRELLFILKNALGTSYIESYDLIVKNENGALPVNALFIEYPVGCICLDLYKGLSSDEVFNCFNLINKFIKILNRRPVLVSRVKRPLGRILRDFNLAKESGDIEILQKYFRELKSSGGIGAKNMIFLEIQMLASCGKWEEIINHLHLKYIIDGLIPPSLLQCILFALGNTGGNYFLNMDLKSIVSINEIYKHYKKFSPIFMRNLELPKDPKYIKEWQLWVVGIVLLGQYSFFEKLPKFIDIQWCGKVLDLVKKNGLVVFEDKPKYQELILEVPLTVEQTKIYLNYCISLPPERWSEIWIFLEKISLEMRNNIHRYPNLKERWDLIESYCSDKVIYGWSNWFEKLSSNSEIDLDQHLLKLHNESKIWSITSFFESQLINILQEYSIKVKETLRNALPLLLEWINANKLDLNIETILLCFNLITDDDKSDPNDLILFHDLLKYWVIYRNNNVFDAQIIMCLDEIVKKCKNNPLYELPTYQQWLMKNIDLLKSLNGLDKKDKIFLKKFYLYLD